MARPARREVELHVLHMSPARPFSALPEWVPAWALTTSALLSLPNLSRTTHRGASLTFPAHAGLAGGRELPQRQLRAQGTGTPLAAPSQRGT